MVSLVPLLLLLLLALERLLLLGASGVARPAWRGRATGEGRRHAPKGSRPRLVLELGGVQQCAPCGLNRMLGERALLPTVDHRQRRTHHATRSYAAARLRRKIGEP